MVWRVCRGFATVTAPDTFHSSPVPDVRPLYGAHSRLRVGAVFDGVQRHPLDGVRVPSLSRRGQGQRAALPARAMPGVRRGDLGRGAVYQPGWVQCGSSSGYSWPCGMPRVWALGLADDPRRGRIASLAEFGLAVVLRSEASTTGAFDRDHAAGRHRATPFGGHLQPVDDRSTRGPAATTRASGRPTRTSLGEH